MSTFISSPSLLQLRADIYCNPLVSIRPEPVRLDGPTQSHIVTLQVLSFRLSCSRAALFQAAFAITSGPPLAPMSTNDKAPFRTLIRRIPSPSPSYSLSPAYAFRFLALPVQALAAPSCFLYRPPRMGVPYPNPAPLHHTLLIYPLRTPLSPPSSISINGGDACLWCNCGGKKHPGVIPAMRGNTSVLPLTTTLSRIRTKPNAYRNIFHSTRRSIRAEMSFPEGRTLYALSVRIVCRKLPLNLQVQDHLPIGTTLARIPHIGLQRNGSISSAMLRR